MLREKMRLYYSNDRVDHGLTIVVKTSSPILFLTHGKYTDDMTRTKHSKSCLAFRNRRILRNDKIRRLVPLRSQPSHSKNVYQTSPKL